MRFEPEFGADGKVISVLAIAHDIHELKTSEQRFRTLAESFPDVVLRFDQEGICLYANPAAETAFALPTQALVGKTLRDLPAGFRLLPEGWEERCVDRVFAEGAANQSELRWVTANEERAFEFRNLPEKDAAGRVVSVLCVGHDVTERMRADEQRREHLHFLESLDRVNRAIQSAESLEQMMSDALDVVQAVFGSDRAFLLYPCDPEAVSWSVPMERTKPEYPGVLALGLTLPMDPEVAATLRTLLAAPGPCGFGPGTDLPLPRAASEQFGFRSLLSMAIYPKTGKPWQFGLHQCSRVRAWTDQEVRLFEEIGRRLSDGLSSALVARDLRASQERFRLVFENSPLPIFEEDFSAVRLRLDRLETQGAGDIEAYLADHPETVRECLEEVRIVDINSAVQQLYDAPGKEILLRGLAQTFLPESYEAFRRELVLLARGETQMVFDSAIRALDGHRREVTVYFAVCPGYEQSLGKVLVSLIDITERKRAEDRTRLAASVFATSQEAILISDARNRIIDVNPAFTRLTGYERSEVCGRDPAFLGAGRQNRELYAPMWQSINDTGAWQGELWNRRMDGEEFVVLLSIVAVQDEKGALQHYVGAFTDISVLKAHESDLDRIAHYDVLTGVPNRRLLGDRLEHAIARSHRSGKSLAVCYLDLDGFKPVNDQFGHEGGDCLLVEIARRLQSMCRADDTVARLGGDEFVLLWNDIGDEAECFQALERILDEVSAPIQLDGMPMSISASIGVTLYPDDKVDADSLLRHADHAMYSAKQLGKNRYQLFDSRLERQITSRVEFLAKVERGLHAGQFALHYQPKVDCVAGRLIGAEALIRWNDPILGMVGPREFLPLIKNDNLAFEMGRWVMEQAVRQARTWHEAGVDVPISVNVFPRHLKYPSFIEDLRVAISRQWPQMPEKRLLMEIVETSELEELEPIEGVIRECLEMGIGFSLDDFGTGYSSLVYLRRLSVEELKIDQSFVRDMLEDSGDQSIVVGVIGLGRAFGLRVVAEGVESEQQARHLVGLGCSVVQGYGFGRPMPAADFQSWYEHFLSNGVRICP